MAYRNKSTKQGRDAWYGLSDFVRNGKLPNPQVLSVGQANRLAYDTSWIPVWGDFLRWRDNTRWINDYMSKNNLTWDDVRYPTRVPGSGSGGSVYFSLSRTLTKLYR